MGDAAHPFDSLEVRFNAPIAAGTFSADDVVLTGPGGTYAPVAVTPVEGDRFLVEFGGVTGLDRYGLTIGPDITGEGGLLMNGDGDATPGEPEDAFDAWLISTATAAADGDLTWDGRTLLLYAATFTLSGSHTFDAIEVLGGAVITHPETTTSAEYRLNLTVTGAVWIDAASAIDVSARGYRQADHGAYTLGNTRTGGAQRWAGGSYGGYGYGPTNEVYGDYRDPNELGSGGAGSGSANGDGGGLVRISARSMLIDGAIRADGGDSWYGGGGYENAAGSGGGIRIDVGTITGTGLISADGGSTSAGSGGGGGGGRIAIYYDDAMGFDLDQVSTTGGTAGAGNGAVGTVYLKDNAGEGVLVLDSHGAPAGTYTPLGLPADATFVADRLRIVGAGVVAAPHHAGLPIQANNLEVREGAILTHRETTTAQEYTLQVAVAGAVVIDADSAIDVSARGYRQADGGAYTLGNTKTGGAQRWAGGSYGGYGYGPTNEVYGDYRDPNELGSGGAGSGSANGDGGGLVRISARSMLLDGAIRADGGDSWYVGGGYENAAGSGGGIRLDVGTLEGAGIISADGGTVTSGAGGAGGGGRIAIYWWNAQNLDPAGITATGGTSAPGAAGAGTVHVAESEAPTDLVVAVDAAPVSAVLGQTILVSWTVTNQGSLPTTDAWADHVYLSADPVWDAGDRLLAAVDASARLPLAGHAAYGVTAAVTGGGWLVPNLPAAGQITLRVEVTPDLNVPSGGEFATSVTAYTTGSPTHLDRVRAVTRSTGGVQPDLAPLPGATPAEADFGQTLALAWTVANAGPGGALRSWTDAVYLSADDVWDAGDTLLASRPAPDTSPLAAGGSYLRQADVTVPNTTGGPHWLIFVTDTAATQPEADEANNAVAVAIDLHGPDLEVAEILGPVLAPTDGQVVTLTARIANTGTGEARGGFYVRFEVDGSLLGRQFVADAVPAGETIEVAQAWTARPGAHTVRVVVDDGGAVYELDDTDNAATLALPEVATADLAVTDVTWLPAAVTDSDTVVFTATLTSAAAATLRNFVVRFQVGGQTIGTQTITGGLGAGQAAQATASWAARPGDYTVVVTVDSTGAVAEADEGNNTLWAALPTISDETPPVVTNLAPTDGQTVRGTVPLAATATDNAGVTGYLFETSDDGLAWTVLGSSAGGTLAWDTGARADGGVQVRVTASDAAGHTATLIHTYVVDNTAPGALALSAAADQFAVVLSWPATAATDFAYYRLYRSETSGGPYTTINGAMTQTTFADRGVTVGTPYYYVLRVFDAVGNASDASAEAWAAPLPDGTVPTITAFSPAAGTRAAGVFHLSASATDNVGVAIYTFEFSDDGGATWQMIASGAASAADWNVSALPTGPVTVRVTAADAQGNASSLQRSLHVDHDGPDQPQNLRTTAGQVRVTVAWDAVLTPDFHHFVLYRAAGGGAMETHVASTTSTVFVDREVDFGVEYAYRVVAVDDLGNPSAPSADATVAPLADTTPPAVQTLSPAGGAYLRGVATLAATALDNVRVTSFVFEVAPAGTGAWTLVGQDDAPAPAGADRWSGSAAWDTSALPEGEYDVRVTAVDYGGNTHTVTATLANPSAAETDPANDTASAQVAVNLAPVANAGADREADWNAAVAFGPGASHDDDGLVTAYAWDFGDGATSGHASPTHAYQMPGAYTVTLTVTDTPTSWSRTCSGRRLTWATATRSSSRWS